MGKRRRFVVALVLGLAVSVGLNVWGFARYDSAKRTFISSAYTHLHNIAIDIDGIVLGVELGEGSEYDVSRMERECILLDATRDGLADMSSYANGHGYIELLPDNRMTGTFEVFWNELANVDGDGAEDKQVELATSARARFMAMIRALSIDKTLSDDDYLRNITDEAEGWVAGTPNFRLSAREVLDVLNTFFENP